AVANRVVEQDATLPVSLRMAEDQHCGRGIDAESHGERDLRGAKARPFTAPLEGPAFVGCGFAREEQERKRETRSEGDRSSWQGACSQGVQGTCQRAPRCFPVAASPAQMSASGRNADTRPLRVVNERELKPRATLLTP